MELHDVHEYALSLPDVTEGFPFGPEVLVLKVCGKMFATLAIDAVPPRMNLKNLPDENVRLRQEHPCVLPGYHMNKEHWNTVVLDGSVPDQLVRDWVETSWRLVAQGLRKSDRVRLGLG